jgi:predicted DNA-binding transcriptional regulator AlpA
MVTKILRRKDVLETFGISTSHLYKLTADGKFPKPNVKLGPQIVGWSEDIIEAHQAKIITRPPKEADQ